MLELRNIILIILLGVCIYLLIKMYSHTTFLIDNAKGYIIENLEEQFDDINEKFQSFEENLDNKLNIFGKKINDIYSVQNKLNKFNEINKMNNQNILHHINQYEEELDEVELEKNCVYNSLENMEYSPQKEINKNNTNSCFVKIKENNNIKDLFYMSPKKSSNTSINNKSNDKELSSTSSIKSGGKSSSQSKKSLVLEITNNYFKTNMDSNSPKSKDVRKILDDTSNALSRNNSFNDLLNLNKHKLYSENVSDNEQYENDDIEINDPPIMLIPDAINNYMNKKVIELK
jgi:hypothetical protein